MRWFVQTEKPNFEYCKELVIDFAGRKAAFGYWHNFPKDQFCTADKARKDARILTFDEVSREDFILFEYVPDANFDNVFCAGANDELHRVLKMSEAEYFTQRYDRKEIIIDLVDGQNSHETRYGAPYIVVYREGRYGVVYDRTVGATGFSLPDVSGNYDIYEEIYDRGIFAYSASAQVEQDGWNLIITAGEISRKGTFSEVGKDGYVEVALENGKTAYFELVDRTTSSLGACLFGKN